MRVSEVYASTQGEGPRVGETTIFTRFGGCNLRCPGWPCDTQHAIDPAFRKEWTVHTPAELRDRILKTAAISGARTVTYTGGEPFLQNSGELRLLTQMLIEDYGMNVECFSNGTLEYPEWAANHISFIMDWKLPGSGEDPYNRMRQLNLELLTWSRADHAVKFVCKDEADFHAAHAMWATLSSHTQGNIQFYYGRVWDGEIENKDLVELVMKYKLPWKLNVQMHNYIWPANERGR